MDVATNPDDGAPAAVGDYSDGPPGEARHIEPSARPALILTALGIVFGDIGTSPLYALKVAVKASGAVDAATILGVLSLILWSLIIVVSVKYVVFVMRADNRGEGGILALASLLWSRPPYGAAGILARPMTAALGLIGAALLFGDGVITPAISVLSAVEGLETVTPLFSQVVIPATLVVLVGLFTAQSHGTERIGRLFGPIMALWFLVIGAMGLPRVLADPGVLAALSPTYAFRLIELDRWTSVGVIGAAFLAVTGAEALYADMGHIGRAPIRAAWFLITFPALMLNYFGQAALVLAHPEQLDNPFYGLVPGWAVVPLVVLSTAATVIASQAVISGVFSLARQALALGRMPRVRIIQTSSEQIGQVYVPSVNWILMILTVLLVVGFQTSDNLAAAYGIAVSATMVITAGLLYRAMRACWSWGRVSAAVVAGAFILVDAGFLGANLVKVLEGGWFPLVAAAAVFALGTIWERGSRAVAQALRKRSEPLATFLPKLAGGDILRIPGTGIFFTRLKSDTPTSVLQHVRHNRVLQSQVVLMTVVTHQIPRVLGRDRLQVEDLGHGVRRIVVHFGFMQLPDIALVLRRCAQLGLVEQVDHASIFLTRETVVRARLSPRLSAVGYSIYAFLARNAASPTELYNLPQDQVMEVGLHIEV